MIISDVQFEQLLTTLKALAASRNYTITGASDWPMLMVVGGIVSALIAFMWLDLRSKLTDHKTDFQEEIKAIKAENKENHDLLWQAMRECQEDCCPRRKAS